MLRWINKIVSEERIRNEYTKGSIDVWIRQKRIDRWFGHVMRREN